MSHNHGFVKLILMIVIGVIALSYIGIDLEEAFKTPLLKKNLVFTYNTAKAAWINYIYTPVSNMFKKDSDEENAPEDDLLDAEESMD